MRSFIVASLAVVVAAPSVARAQFKEIGKTAVGNLIFVDPKTVKTKDGITSARLQVKFVSPVATPQGPWVVSRHDAMFDCAKRTVANKSSTYYSDAKATKVVKKDVVKIPGFGSPIGGSMTQIALDYVCANKK